MRLLRSITVSAFAFGAAVLVGSSAFAMSSNDSDTSNSQQNKATSCKSGQAKGVVSKKCVTVERARKECNTRGRKWNKDAKKCLRGAAFGPRHEEIFEKGKEFAYAGSFDQAVDTLEAIASRKDPRVLNMIGYSFRKLGKMDTAFAYYRRALSINPDFTLARSYLGEGLVKIGDFSGARGQLAVIKALCGETCQEYQILNNAILKAS